MGFLTEIPAPERRNDQNVCHYCEATPASCRSREWLTDRRCCQACAGNHDTPEDA